MDYPVISHLVSGKAELAAGYGRRAVTNPANGATLGEIPFENAELLDRIAETAWRGFLAWREVPTARRTEILKRAAALLREDADALARIITLEQGKVITESRGEIHGTAAIFEWMADEAERIAADLLPRRADGFRQAILHEPIGPVLAIAPWNMPALLTGRKIAHALATGCSVIAKPASETPGIAMELAHRLIKAGVPPEAITIVHGNSARIAEALIAAPQIRKVSFTGSTEVGRSLGALCGHQIKRFTAELGGHAPVILLRDADLARAVSILVKGKFINAGQSCMAPTRFFVHADRIAEFSEAFAEKAGAIKVGDGMDTAHGMGTVINGAAVKAMQSFVDDAVRHGSKVLTGGSRLGTEGCFYAPTVLTDVPATARIMQDEPYGPLAPIACYDTIDEAVARANETAFGLCGYVFGQDPPALRQLTEQLELGVLGINTLNVGGPMVPFGGVKDSGIGREGSRHGLLEHMALKAVTSDMA